MRLREFANAEEQLELLRVIIDNTWAAIAKQAAEQRKAEQERLIAAAKVPRSKRGGSSSATPIPAPVPAPAAPKQQASVQDKGDNDNEFDDNPNSELNQKPASPHSKKSKPDISSVKGSASNATATGLLTAKHALTAEPVRKSSTDVAGDDIHSRNGTSAQKKHPRIFQR
jgi:hypothetical protein